MATSCVSIVFPLWLLAVQLLPLLLCAGKMCDFERETSCDWHFEPTTEEGGFKSVAGTEISGKSGKSLQN